MIGGIPDVVAAKKVTTSFPETIEDRPKVCYIYFRLIKSIKLLVRDAQRCSGVIFL